MLNANLYSPLAKLTVAGLLLSGALGATTDSAPSGFDPRQALRTPAEAEPDAKADRRKLESAVDDAKDLLDAAAARLALANWWLSVPTARPATRWILDMEDEPDLKTIADAGRNAKKQLAQARDAMKQAPRPHADEDKRRARELREAADTLDAFADIFQNAELPANSQADQEAWRKAGRGLTIARESNRADVAAAALLWQAFALDQAGKRDRALDALPDALAKPQHLPYDLMSRLLRCRLMAEAGQVAAATTLLGRMEGQLKNWMDNQNQERNKARRLIGLVQYETVTRWMNRLKSATRPAADPLQPVLEAVERTFSEVKNPEVYYMPAAIPLGIDAPEKKGSSTATRSAPAE